MQDPRLWITVGIIAIFAALKAWPYVSAWFAARKPDELTQTQAFTLAMQLVEFFRRKKCVEGEKLARDTAKHLVEASCDELTP